MWKRHVAGVKEFAVLAGAVLLAVSQPAPLRGQIEDAASQTPAGQGCVLLRNGNVLLGSIRPSDDGYVVTRQGATVHVPGYQVQVICADLAAAYEHQRTAISHDDAVAHLQLAEWCIQQGLCSEAEQELETAARGAATHPRLAILQRRLAIARETHAAGTAERRDKRVVRASDSPADLGLVDTTGASSNVPMAGTQPGTQVPRLASAKLPDNSMEQFRRRIQPLLLNTCTTSGCHGTERHGGFVLDRRALWGNATPTLTSENLAAVLKLVDREAPRESPLLWAATQAHAPGLKNPPISAGSKTYAVLEDWLLHLSGQDATDREAPDAAVAETEEVGDESIEAAGESADVTITDEELDALLHGEEEPSILDRRIRRGVRPVPVRRGDPFDPKEFNDRFSPRAREPQHR